MTGAAVDARVNRGKAMTWTLTPMTSRRWSNTSVSKTPCVSAIPPAIARSRYIGRHGTERVAKAVLIGSVTPLMLKTISETDMTEDLKKFDIPTLIMQGDDDQIVPIAGFGNVLEDRQRIHVEDLSGPAAWNVWGLDA
jgi:alpha-beta hydrolase superfamily lysophospholipase